MILNDKPNCQISMILMNPLPIHVKTLNFKQSMRKTHTIFSLFLKKE
jgi:hypothetical protein